MVTQIPIRLSYLSSTTTTTTHLDSLITKSVWHYRPIYFFSKKRFKISRNRLLKINYTVNTFLCACEDIVNEFTEKIRKSH